MRIVSEQSDTPGSEPIQQDPYFTSKTYQTIERAYLELVDDLEEAILIKFPTPTPDVSSPIEAGRSGSSARNDLPLQRVQIPTFKGDYDSWATFRDLYTAAVHNQSNMTSATKLWNLKSLMSGRAAELLADYNICDGDYEGAWALLNERFDNKRVLINNEIGQLLD